MFIIDDHLDIRTILEKHLTAIPARRNDAMRMLLVNGNNRIKFSFAFRNSDAHCDILRTSAMNSVAIDALIDFSVATQQSASYRVIVCTLIKVPL